MPGKIKVKVLAGRNLPVMDRASDTTDAFVEIKFGGITHKTDVCRKSLNPHWNSTEWYRFEVDESELQDEPLQLRLMDHDTYSANDAIGKVVISLAPLLAREANNVAGTAAPGGAVLSGWIPVFDTMHGIRGELNVIVKVELFSDFNKYKTSSVGVQFFHCPMIPPGYKATAIHGFVEELIVNDDPEYQWIDKIRTPRASNEARQVAFIKLSNQVQRLVGLKAAELGANAVVGYQQDFDLEGEAGVVARAIGTAVSISPLPTPQHINQPCTQQQLKKYLDILASDEDSAVDLNQYYQTHQEELLKMVCIMNPKTPLLLDEPDGGDDDEKSFESLAPPTSFTETQKIYSGGRSIYQDEYVSQKSLKHLYKDQEDLDKLLNRSASTDSTGTLTKLKKLRGGNFLKKLQRRTSATSQRSDNDDTVSLKSTSSDTSRISLGDIKKELRRFKRIKMLKLPKVESEEDTGIGMASILARSIIHAHTSLACITEAQDSETSPESTLRRTSESEPTVNVPHENLMKPDSDKKTPAGDIVQIPDIHCISLENIKTNDELVEPKRKISESCPTSPMVERNENLLTLPGEVGYFGSMSSALSAGSSEIYSTTDEEDDDSYDIKSSCEQSLETTSSLVNSVLRHDIDPNFIAQMEQKLTVLELASHEHHDSSETANHKETEVEIQQPVIAKENTRNEIETVENSSRHETTHKEKDKCVPAKNNFNFHNIFAHKNPQSSFSAPSSPVERKSFVYRSSKRIKRQLSKISKSRMIKSLSHYSLIPKKKNVDPKSAMSQPGSSSDVTSKAPSDTVLGYPFLSYTDLLSLDKEKPLNRLHKSDELDTHKVSMYIGSEPESRASFSSPWEGKDDNHHEHRLTSIPKKEKPEVKPDSLTHTAMEIILIDKIQSLLIPTSPDPVKSENKRFFDKVNKELEKIENTESKTVDPKMPDNKRGSIKTKRKEKKLLRQDSIRSVEGDGAAKMSKDLRTNIVIPCKLTHQPVLQHFHPILSGAQLETIPSLSECSLDKADSVDVGEFVTNSVSVCGNSHAVCDVDRTERERDKCEKDRDKGSPKHSRHESFGGREHVGSANAQNVSLNSSSTPLGIHRRSSDSDLSVTPKGGSQNASISNIGGGAILRPSMNSNNLEMLEYPFLTMTEYPPGFIVHIGGTVCSRSVKLVDGGGESAARAAWWAELRTEIRAHARALRCTAVLAYSERASVREDVCVLSASGTAAVINLDCDLASDETISGVPEEAEGGCSKAHVPYSPGAPPYRSELAGCGGCRRARVPTVLLATCAKPRRLASYGKSVVLTAVAARGRRAPPSSEPGARDLSDQLPFLEYELHKLLLAKLRMQGANALFSLQTQIAIGERCVMALASGAAVRLAALPPPSPPRIKASENDKNALDIQKSLWDTFAANKLANGFDVGVPEHVTNGVLPEVEGEDPPVLDLCADKDACVLELDEAEDVETARALAERRPAALLLSAALRPARAPPHAFTQVWRARAGSGAHAERMVNGALTAAQYKLRRLQPAALASTTYHLDLPEDEIQLVVSGTAISLQDPKLEHAEKNGSQEVDDDIFALDEEQLIKSPPEPDEKNNGPGAGRVTLSTGSGVPGARASRRVCALRLLFVRETTAVRELGGLSGFLHTFTCEVMAIVRAYTAALGGNALTSFYVTQLMLQDNAHKNQGQCLLSIGGDVVQLIY